MICPSKLCKCEIPDDSLYCDQCGIKILRCEKCGNVGITKFCGKCGGSMVFKDLTPASSAIPTAGSNPSSPSSSSNSSSSGFTPSSSPSGSSFNSGANIPPTTTPIDNGGGSHTVIVPLNNGATNESVLELFNNNGWSIMPKDGNILGRTTGEFCDKLGAFPVISSRHAQIRFVDGQWYITDLGSTNKSYINSKMLIPNQMEKLSNNDVLVLANVSFVVRIK